MQIVCLILPAYFGNLFCRAIATDHQFNDRILKYYYYYEILRLNGG